MALGLACATAPVARADAPAETVIPAAPRVTPRGDTLVFGGPGGFLHKQEGQSGYVWTKYAGGPDTPMPVSTLLNPQAAGAAGSGSDVVTTSSSVGTVLNDMDAGTETTIRPPGGQTYMGTFGSHLLMEVPGSTSGTAAALHILSEVGGQLTDTTATGWPTGATPLSAVLAGDATSAVVSYSDSTGTRLALLDLTSGQVTPIFGEAVPGDASVLLSDDYIAWYSAEDTTTVHLMSRSDLTAPETAVQVPAGTTGEPVQSFGIAGGWLLIAHGASATDDLGGSLDAMPLSGGTPSTLLGHVPPDSVRTGSDSALVVGGSSATDWSARRVAASSDGTLTVASVDSDPAVPSPLDGLAMAGGELFTTERDSTSAETVFTRSIQLGATPSYGDHTRFAVPDVRSDCDTAADCVPPMATGTGEISQLWKGANSDGDSVTVQQDQTLFFVQPGATGGTLVDSNGRYVVYDGGSTGKQYISDVVSGDAQDGYVLFTRPITGAALSGATLWAANSTAGSISSIDIPTQKTTRTISTGASCVPSELQAAGRWVYWSCGTSGPAGVYDLATGEEIPVPSSGPAQLGDGYLVEHDMNRGELELTDFHTDTAVTSDLAALPAGPLTDDRRVTWAVDKYGGGIAYTDAQNDIHIVDPHIPTTPLSVTDVDTAPAEHAGTGTWTGQWQLSEPAASATVTIGDAAGHVLRTMNTSETGVSVAVSWNGLTDSGAKPADGPSTWTLAVTASDGTKAVSSGSLWLYGGVEDYREYSGWGQGSLVTLTSTGWLTAHTTGSDDGTFDADETSGGWPSGTTAVPFGDTDGDGCNELLVRTPSGELREYHRECGQWPSPTSSYTSLGTGWNQYKWLSSPGDLTGDGRPDLLAWNASDGDLYVIPSTAQGTLGTPQLVRTGLSYTRLISVGDVTGDGVGDLLAYDHEGSLWLMAGDGHGDFQARKLIFGNWGQYYNAMIGVGDITGDGKPDLVERDSSGTVWVNPGLGNGSFGGRTEAATSFNYTGVF